MTIVMDQEFVAQTLCFHHKPFVTIGSETDDGANDAVARDLYGREAADFIRGPTSRRIWARELPRHLSFASACERTERPLRDEHRAG